MTPYKRKKFTETIGSYDNIYFIDIDNTIAYTWQTLDSRWLPHPIHLLFLKPKKRIIERIDEIIGSDKRSTKIIFLSARSKLNFITTFIWLVLNVRLSTRYELIVVDKVSDKKAYIDLALAGQKNLTIFDDLSFGHESGRVSYYYELINYIKDHSTIVYYDYQWVLDNE